MNKLRGTDSGDCYGLVKDGTAYIIRSVFNKVCQENAINAKALLSHLRSKGLIETSPNSKAYTRSKWIGGQPVNCVCLKLPIGEIDENDELPL